MDSADLARRLVSDVAVAALRSPPGSNVVGPALEALRTSIGADVAGYYRHEWEGWTTALYITPDEAWRRVPNARMPTALAAAAHPGIRYCVEHPLNQDPFTITDLVSERAWLGSELGRLMRPEWGRNYQLAIPVRSSPGRRESRVFVLGRAQRDFTIHDRWAAEAVREVLEAVSHHAECREWFRAANARPASPLTEREVLVIQLLDEGLTALGVGAQLGISPRTVQKHTERIYRKLGVRDRRSALEVATSLSVLAPRPRPVEPVTTP